VSHRFHLAVLGLLVLIWGSTWAAIKIGLRGMPPFTGIALRFTIAGALLLVVMRLSGLSIRPDARIAGLWVVNAILTFSVSYGAVYWAEQWLPSGLTSILFATYPLWLALLAHFWLPGERLTPRMATCIVLGFAGVVVIFGDDLVALAGARANIAAAVLMIAPLAAATGNLIVKRWGSGIHPLHLTAVPMLMTGALMGVLAAVTERHRPLTADATAIGALLYLAVIGSALAFTLYFWLLDRLPATQLSLIVYCAPVMAVAIGVLVLGESVSGPMLLGATMVVAGVSFGATGAPRDRPPSARNATLPTSTTGC